MPFGNNHIIHPCGNEGLVKTKKFPHNPLDTIAPHGIPHFFAYSKAESPGVLVSPVKDKKNKMRRKIPTAPFVACFKLGPSDKMIRFGKC